MGKVLLAAIILPFVISGFYGYFVGGSTGDVVAEVEGSKITRSVVNQRVERVRNMLREQSPNMNPALLDSFVRPEMVLDGIVNEQLILAAAEQSSMDRLLPIFTRCRCSRKTASFPNSGSSVNCVPVG